MRSSLSQPWRSETSEHPVVADPRLLSDGHGFGESMPMMTRAQGSRGRDLAPDGFTFDITPVVQTVRATVEACFTMRAPDEAALRR